MKEMFDSFRRLNRAARLKRTLRELEIAEARYKSARAKFREEYAEALREFK